MLLKGIHEIAKRFHVGPMQVYDWIGEGAPIAQERHGNRVGLSSSADEDELRAWLATRTRYIGADVAKRLFPHSPEQALLAAIFMTEEDLRRRFRGVAPEEDCEKADVSRAHGRPRRRKEEDDED